MSGKASYGEAFGRRFGAEAAPVFVAHTLRKSEVAVTYLRQDQPTFELSEQQPIEDAYMVSFVMEANPHYTLWENGRPVSTQPVPAGYTTFYDFKAVPIIHINNPLVALHFYLPRSAFDAIAENAGAPRIGDFKYPRGFGVDDQTIRGLGMALMPAFEKPEQASRLFVDHVTIALGVHVAHAYGRMRAPVRRQGGLAPWQERRVKEILAANLDGDISLTMLANDCHLSTGHFARAFRKSTGMAPHQWLLHRRVEAAMGLLRNSPLTLSEVALATGFAHQAHFTRVFSRIVGVAPGAWRRALEK